MYLIVTLVIVQYVSFGKLTGNYSKFLFIATFLSQYVYIYNDNYYFKICLNYEIPSTSSNLVPRKNNSPTAEMNLSMALYLAVH